MTGNSDPLGPGGRKALAAFVLLVVTMHVAGLTNPFSSVAYAAEGTSSPNAASAPGTSGGPSPTMDDAAVRAELMKKLASLKQEMAALKDSPLKPPPEPAAALAPPPPLPPLAAPSASATCSGTWVEALPGRERRVFSQNHEDGITLALIEQIKPKKKFFVEFGTESGAEVNTRDIRENHGWTGIMLDGSHEIPSINLHKTMILEETIVSEFQKYNVPIDMGILSVDIDSYDFWISKAILEAGYKPDIIITEVNSQIGDEMCLTVPPAKVLQKPFLMPGSVNFGTSVPAYAALMKKHGYTTVYCERIGVNCFHVKSSALTPDILAACPVGRRAYKPPAYVGPPHTPRCWPDNGIPFYEMDCDTLEIKRSSVKPAPYGKKCKSMLGK